MSRKLIALLLVLVILPACLFAYFTSKDFTWMDTMDVVPGGAFGFRISVVNETKFWISAVDSIDTEATEFHVANTTAQQEVGQLVLQTKEMARFNFSISRSLLYLDGDSSKSSMDYVLRLRSVNESGVTEYRVISADSPCVYSYTKSDDDNMKNSVGMLTAQVNGDNAPRPGMYISTISVELSVEE